MICGVDFDNTIVSYDEVLARIARELGLIDADGVDGKRGIRDRIRRLPDGEIEWQKCQALLYGPRIGEARLMDGVREFFQECRRRGVPVYVVSHKTEFAGYGSKDVNLRAAAMGWMEANGCFDAAGLGLTREQVFFAGTRREKLARIAELGCTHFVDDLEETFAEEDFPARTVRILYEPGRRDAAPAGVRVAESWREIGKYLFDGN